MSKLLTISQRARLKAATTQNREQTVLSIHAVDNRRICLYCQGGPQKARKRGNASAICVRDRLLGAADRLFYQEGVRAVGIDRVLAEADAAKASLYQHFGCKDQLVASYLERGTVAARADTRGPPRKHRGVPRRHAAVTTRAQVFRLGGGVGGVEGLPRLPVAAYGDRAHRCGAPGARHCARSARVVHGAFPRVVDGGGGEGRERDGSRACRAVRRCRRGV